MNETDKTEEEKSPKSPNDGSVNLSINKSKKSVNIVKDKDDVVTSSEKVDSKSTRNSDVWRPY